jgi:6-hydroxycyclohex-1-ene-1-carbonyl-CoA dehydrogenase
MHPAEVVVRVAGCALGVEPEAEIAGEVVAAGEAARDWLGRKVVVPRLLPCGDCDRCRRGRAASCASRAPRHGLAPEERVPARFLCALDGSPPLWPAGLDSGELWRAAALADAASAPFAALARAGLAPGDLVAVIGETPRAQFAAAIVAAKGGRAVKVDSSLAPEESLAALPGAPEIVLETSGSAAGRHRALAMLPEGSTAVFLDGPGERLPVPPPDWSRFCAGERRLLGAEAAHPDFLPEVCALFARGELRLDVVAISPDEIDATIAARRAGKLHQLPIVRFR